MARLPGRRNTTYDAPSVRPDNNRVALLGDSRTFGCVANDASNFGNSGQSWISYACQFSRQRVYHDPATMNFGVAGDTLAQMLGRLTAALAASDAGMWIVFGGTNSANADVLADGPNGMIATMTAIRNKILNAGRVCVFLDEAPRGDTSFTAQRFLAARLLNFHGLVKWIRTQQEVPGCYVVPIHDALAVDNSTTGDTNVGDTYDGLHQAGVGAYKIGLRVSTFFNSIYPERPILCDQISDLYDATSNVRGSLVANPVLAGTTGTINVPASGTATGSLADSWTNLTTNSTGMTLVYSKVTTGGKNWQQVEVGGTPTGGTPTCDILRIVPLATQMALGDTVEGFCEYEIDASAANVKHVALFLFDQTSSKSYFDMLNGRSEVLSIPTTAYSGIMRIPRTVLLSTNLRYSVQVRGFTGAAITLTARFRAIDLRKIIP